MFSAWVAIVLFALGMMDEVRAAPLPVTCEGWPPNAAAPFSTPVIFSKDAASNFLVRARDDNGLLEVDCGSPFFDVSSNGITGLSDNVFANMPHVAFL